MQQATSPSSVGDGALTDGGGPQRLVGTVEAHDAVSNPSPADGSPDVRTGIGDDVSLASTTNAATQSSNLSRKRKQSQGGRGVANLTPAQLEKKRANDREAQRNIRERTKAQIESLERTIEQLRSQQPYQELQRVVREKEALEAELADLRRTLATVLSLIQPHVSGALDPRGNQSNGDFHLTGAIPHSALPSGAIPRAGFHHDNFMQPIDVGATPLSAASATYSMPWQSQPSDSPASQTQPPPFAPRPRSPNGQPTLLGMASSIYRMTDNEQEALTLLRLGEPRSIIDPFRPGDTPRSTSTGPLQAFGNLSESGTPPQLQQQPVDENAPIWTRRPSNLKATCTLDTICLTFLIEIEKRLEQGASVKQAVGDSEPDWHFIANPDAIEPGQEHTIGPLSRFFGQVLSHRMFPDLQKPPEKVGTAWLLYTNSYWQVTRSKEDFDRLPEWLRPSKAALMIPHGPWVDAMFWPELRDAVIMSQNEYRFDELFVPLTKTVSCNWPYSDEEVFDTSSGRYKLSDRFLRHIKKLENWTLGPEFIQAYPRLRDKFNLRAT